jgi:hypothetical protein
MIPPIVLYLTARCLQSKVFRPPKARQAGAIFVPTLVSVHGITQREAEVATTTDLASDALLVRGPHAAGMPIIGIINGKQAP